MSETQEHRRPSSGGSVQRYPPAGVRASEPVNLADLLERVLDKGIVIAGDIRLYLGGIELLTLKIRLLIASVDKAQEIGINWWESDPALSAQNKELRHQRDDLSRRLDRIETNLPGVQEDPDYQREHEPAISAQNRELRRQRDELEERLTRIESMLSDLQQQQSSEGGGQSRRGGGRRRQESKEEE